MSYDEQTELRMRAYYYGFEATGDREIDKILSAVARAGKAFHHTESWSDETYDPVTKEYTGPSHVDLIQHAADKAAEHHRAEVELLHSHITAHEDTMEKMIANGNDRENRLQKQRADVERLTRERDAWIETARQHCGNEEYYRGLVQRIGKTFGVAAYTSDDGSVQQDVLCAKVPELAESSESALAAAQKRIAELEGAARETLNMLDNLDREQAVLPVQQAKLRAALAGGTASR